MPVSIYRDPENTATIFKNCMYSLDASIYDPIDMTDQSTFAFPALAMTTGRMTTRPERVVSIMKLPMNEGNVMVKKTAQ